jgi:hypothetical protein
MYWVPIVLVAGAVCSDIPDSTAIQPVGAFSNMRFTEEHAYGYTVELWKGGRCLFGLFEASEGLAGDTPTGLLQSVRYDAATGKLDFAAKLTMGVTKPNDGADWVPSRDGFEFTGHLSSRTLQGRLAHSDQFRPEAKALTENIVLSLSKEQQELMLQAANFGDWRKQAEALLHARGPKW